MELVNKIIYNNIYNDHGEENAESQEQSQSIREGMLLLHRGGLASFKWMKYVCPLIIEALLSQNSHRTVLTVLLVMRSYLSVIFDGY